MDIEIPYLLIRVESLEFFLTTDDPLDYIYPIGGRILKIDWSCCRTTGVKIWVLRLCGD